MRTRPNIVVRDPLEENRMRTTLDLNRSLVERAQKMTKIKGKTDLIHEALRLLIARAAQVELSRMKGVQKNVRAPKRRKIK